MVNPEVISPSQADVDFAKLVLPCLRVLCTRPDGLSEHDRQALPELIDLSPGAAVALQAVLREFAAGHAVSISTPHVELTTEKAAELLQVSRPYFVGLLESGQIPFRTVGKHRRVLLTDALTYKRDNGYRRAVGPHNIDDPSGGRGCEK